MTTVTFDLTDPPSADDVFELLACIAKQHARPALTFEPDHAPALRKLTLQMAARAFAGSDTAGIFRALLHMESIATRDLWDAADLAEELRGWAEDVARQYEIETGVAA